MRNLIAELKQEHAVISARLVEARALGISSAQGRDHLLLVKSTLLAHLAKEDQQLYPKLREAAANDRQLETLLKIFARDMEQVSGFAIQFFAKFESGVATSDQYLEDVAMLLARLRFRIGNEEQILYREYQRVSAEELRLLASST